MKKIGNFGSFLTGVDNQKLSNLEGERKIAALLGPMKGFTVTCSPLQDNNNNTKTGTRSRSQDLSKSAMLFERGLRKSSSLTNGIDSVHCSNMDTNRIQESMAKKARGLTVHSDLNITSTSFMLNISGEQPTMVERRKC
jgi:hypothetical protein